ncbi:hypothetical protein RJ640_019715 [Escallonia rubra]|uniref:Uncharacterized protein n=1 Tax=Escallonia rubra TaxID=112253 RepID=A0AA88RQN6_9ASTE|nr:hypothetical protein RJ640_019715 [Escallonia rubra]
MATLSKAEPGRMYSWWWDSHIPKNSKWLQENLTDTHINTHKLKMPPVLIELRTPVVEPGERAH